MSISDIVYGPGAALTRSRRSASARRGVSIAALAWTWPIALASMVGGVVFVRARMIWAPEGDSALHYKLITDLERTHRLPSSLPHYVARLGPGGIVESMFPYAYTPLFHIAGALAYAIGGEYGVSLIGAVC